MKWNFLRNRLKNQMETTEEPNEKSKGNQQETKLKMKKKLI